MCECISGGTDDHLLPTLAICSQDCLVLSSSFFLHLANHATEPRVSCALRAQSEGVIAFYGWTIRGSGVQGTAPQQDHLQHLTYVCESICLSLAGFLDPLTEICSAYLSRELATGGLLSPGDRNLHRGFAVAAMHGAP